MLLLLHIIRFSGILFAQQLLPLTDKMTFTERWYNTLFIAYDWFLRRFILMLWEEALVQKNFGHLAPLPSLDDVLHNVSLTFVNSHRAIAPPRPSMPGTQRFKKILLLTTSKLLIEFCCCEFSGVIAIGGAHVQRPKPLTNDIKQFLDEAEHGVIYFSLGSILHSSKLSAQLIQIFLGKICSGLV